MNWLNRMLGMEPAINTEGQDMVGFYFNEEYFVATDPAKRAHYKKLVAANVFFLVLVGLNQKKYERGMTNSVKPAEAEWDPAPQPLMSHMYRPPEATFAKH